MSRFGAFHDTRNLYIEYTGYKKPLSYEEWAKQPDSLKAALLYVQFYDAVTLAWDKADSLDFGDDAEGVSIVLQYFQKQVSDTEYRIKSDLTKKANAEFRRKYPDEVIQVEVRRIDENPEKFSSSWLYRVAYNCLYCICGHDRQRDKDIIENETSAIGVSENGEFNIIERVVDYTNSVESRITKNAFEHEFWSVIESAGLSAEKVMRYLLSGNVSDLEAARKNSEAYLSDPLRDVKVSLAEVDEIINSLREKFMALSVNSECGKYVSQFTSLVTQFA